MTLMLITEPPKAAIRSFIVVLYNGCMEEVGRFHVPVSVAAPFTNRLFESVLPGCQVREPWYSLLPQYSDGSPFKRAPYPVGLTSLTSTRYAPEEEPPPRVTLHPHAALRSFTVRLLDYQTELYKGDYSVDDIFLA
ncbi:MAG: hypothetical protein RBT75_12615, partial [Anaerolineae bacterium]|nr:hypothetical protein [Anaerolineae bacterium]